MPIYEYSCLACGFGFEQIEKASKFTYKENLKRQILCPNCKEKAARRAVEFFKIGSGILNTANRSGYADDDLTLGKLIDEGGIPAENQRQLRERDERIKRMQKYTKGLKKRGQKYGFDPFSVESQNNS